MRDDATGRRVGRVVELEAYIGPEDRASHARFGRTPRNAVMYGPPGHAYVYLVYGMYDCLNLVTEPDGMPAALLVRAVEPLEGIGSMRIDRTIRATTRRRGLTDERVAAEAERLARLPRERLASGPGLVAAAYGIDTAWTGVDLCDPASPLRLEAAPAHEGSPAIAATPRIGIDYAGAAWTTRPWRFIAVGHPSVSGPMRTR